MVSDRELAEARGGAEEDSPSESITTCSNDDWCEDDSVEYGDDGERILEGGAAKRSDLDEACVWPSNFREPVDLVEVEITASCIGGVIETSEELADEYGEEG
jgi:hypothetical protein